MLSILQWLTVDRFFTNPTWNGEERENNAKNKGSECSMLISQWLYPYFSSAAGQTTGSTRPLCLTLVISRRHPACHLLGSSLSLLASFLLSTVLSRPIFLLLRAEFCFLESNNVSLAPVLTSCPLFIARTANKVIVMPRRYTCIPSLVFSHYSVLSASSS